MTEAVGSGQLAVGDARLRPSNDDDEPTTVTLPIEQVRLLTAAADVVTQLWGDLAAGDQITLGDVNTRILAAGLAEQDRGVTVISEALTDAIVEADVACDRSEADEVSIEDDGWDDDLDDERLPVFDEGDDGDGFPVKRP